jgi:hypothetical protein
LSLAGMSLACHCLGCRPIYNIDLCHHFQISPALGR